MRDTPSPQEAPADDTRRADALAATSFFNALLRESSAWRFERDEDENAGGEEAGGENKGGENKGGEKHIARAGAGLARMALDETGRCVLCIRLLHRSLAGRCRLALPLFLEIEGRREAVDFIDAVRAVLKAPWVVHHPLIGELDDQRRERFLKSVIESRDNIAASLAERGEVDDGSGDTPGFLDAEQGLLAGHDFHPAPKSRAPFTLEEARRYTPEHRARFRLAWWGVSPARAVGASSRARPAPSLTRELLPEALARHLPPDWVALPLHPWQSRYLAGRAEIAPLIEADELRVLGDEPGGEDEREGRFWYPTSSHRSLYSPQAEWMVKGSLSARLTNSVRVLHENEVMRGLRLDQWWPEVGDEIKKTFELMQEPAWLGFKGESGEIEEASLAVLRENAVPAPKAPLIVLATLAQPLAGTGETLLSASVRRLAARQGGSPAQAAIGWFDDYLDHVLSPLIRLVVEEGIVMLAHQQNILVRLDNDRPAGVLYRDCQGSGVTEHFFTRHPQADVSRDHRISDAMLKRYFPYYVLLNATLAVSGALAEAGLVDERELMGRLRACLERLQDVCRDGDVGLILHLLTSPVFEAKGNFFCYLSGINESTLDDPSRIYVTIANPLVDDERILAGPTPFAEGV